MIRSLPVLLLLAACGGADEPHDDAPDLSTRVQWAQAEASNRVPVATLPAEAVGRSGATSHIGPPGGGRIVAWEVEPGEAVAEGDVLAWMISPDLSSLRVEMQALDAQVARAQVAATQARRAADRGVRSAADAQLAEAELASVQAQRRALQSRLAVQKDTITAEGGRWAWRSPGPGVVQEITCNLDTVTADSRCVTMVRPDQTQVLVRVPERHLPALKGEVGGTFLSADGRTWNLSLAAMAPAVDPHSRTRALRFDAEQTLIPGISGRATLVATGADGVVAIPDAALTRVEGQPAVMRQRADGTGEPVIVRIIGREPDTAYVTGLLPEDPVAVKGVFLLKSLELLDDDAGHEH
mgnify:CR=1 FL=1